MLMQSLKANLGVFWGKYETKVVLIIGMILIATVSFEFGLTQGKKGQSSPLIIEKAAQAQDLSTEGCSVSSSGAQNLTPETKKPIIGTGAQTGSQPVTAGANCAYVGSKNSNKFYPPTCSYAKRIKPENIVCFATAEEAIAQGRAASTGCK